MNEENQWFYEGRRIALSGVLGDVLIKLGVNSPEQDKAAWVIEKSDLLLDLRVLCRDFGDDSFSPNTGITEIINTYLYPYLQAEVEHSQAMEKLINKAIRGYDDLRKPFDPVIEDMKCYMKEYGEVDGK